MLSLAIEFGRLSVQAWNFQIVVVVAALGWALATRREASAALPGWAALTLGAMLLVVMAITSASAYAFQHRADLALAAAQALATEASDAHSKTILALGETTMRPADFFKPMMSERNVIVLGLDLVAALTVAAVASPLGRRPQMAS